MSGLESKSRGQNLGLGSGPNRKNDGPIIHFPFKLSHQPKHCGYPGFELHCNNKKETVLELSSFVHLVVEEIDYVSQQINLYYPDECIAAKLLKLNLSQSNFRNDDHPTVLFNCSASFRGGFLVPCLGSSGYQVYAISSTFSLDFALSDPCTKIHQYPYSVSTFGQNKLQLNWPIPLCSNCEFKGMDCGFKNGTNLLETHCFNRTMTKKGITKQPLIAGVVLGTVLVCIIVFSLYQLYLTSRNERESRVRLEKFLEDYKAIRPTRYSYADIKKITDDFNEKLGEGSYGTVYKGRLSSEIYVAVKVLRDSKGKGEEFINEIGTIGRIHHVNVVRLVGFCADGFRRALIYKYLPNDSLERFILPVSSSPGSISLISWNKLQHIALGTARGIEYLHQGCDQQILHFDIKPQNILLDHNLNPKICDFGLAKLCSKEKSVVTMTAARGTIGYIAPEVLSRNFGKVSHKSDVYSFGILLLEMVGGRIKMDSKTNNHSKVNSLEWIYRNLEKGEELKIRIQEEGDGTIVRKLAIVGLWCIQWHPIDRPSIKKSKHYCPPSACGHIRNISYPFHLNTDPEHCGNDHPAFELACEDNQTVTPLILSKKMHVQDINYDNWTIHLVDPTLQTQDHLCSLIPQFNFYADLHFFYYNNPESIFIFNCPFAVNNNSSTFVEISGCKLSRHTYLKIGDMKASEVSDGCRVQCIGLTSWPNIKDAQNNISLSDFHQAILYRFELHYYSLGSEQRMSVIQMILGFSWWLPPVFMCKLLYIPLARARMTSGFKEILGERGYGNVYKGKLQSGRHVAVKMLSKPKAGGQDFMNEVSTIGRIHHVNVVGLVGYCVEGTYCALVYDFMPNGSLDKYISTSQEGSPLLSWQRKYDIILGVARGIGYLHRGCDVQNLHFDIKPHNILLDENFIPKISDFGLAKLYPTDNSIVNLTAAHGTIGYVAPNFGMLLMETLDLKRNEVANEENYSQYFPYCIYDKFNKGKEIVVDEKAHDDEKKMARKLTLVALWCIQTNPIQRPSMSRVLEMLEGEVEVLEVPPDQPVQSQPTVHQIMGSSMTFSSDSMHLLENSADNPVEIDICSH
ncbi:hypothetical protein H5410_001251 [Solanum commersonii]|uniref:non-specific serine/threonine protein kinase n=1 Tax=Solanum commersonii TaxID=4109 RepID=A0A9J6AYE0_SOLCO|nr:hypothetical protein H5410_001251 [Solanum commersonii]